MAGSSPLECGVCNENFNEEDRCPRILPCYHHICSCCIEQLIGNDQKSCPFCRESFQAQSAKDIRINTGVLDLVTFIAHQATKVSSGEREDEDEDAEKNLGGTTMGLVYVTENASNNLLRTCREFEGLIDQSVKNMAELTTSLTSQNDTISTDIINHFSEVVNNNDSNVEELKGRGERILEYRKTLKEKEEELKILKEKLRTSDDKFTEDDDVRKEVEELNKSVSVWIAGLKEIFNQDTEIREKIGKELRTTTRLTDVVQGAILSVEDDEGATEGESLVPTAPPMAVVDHPRDPPLVIPGHCQAVGFEGTVPTMSNMNISQYSESLESATVLRKMTPAMLDVIYRGSAFAIQRDGCKRGFARLSIHRDNLHLHALQDGVPPPNTTLLDVNEVLQLAAVYKPVAFLDLSMYGIDQGRLYIDMKSMSSGSRNFLQMCTGEKGPSYAHTNFLSVQAKGTVREAIQGGDYEYNTGRGGKTLVKGLDLSDHIYKGKWEAGLVRGASFQNFSQFYIHTRNRSDTVCRGVIGKVSSGMHILSNLINTCDDITQVNVNDCGIILPCSFLIKRRQRL